MKRSVVMVFAAVVVLTLAACGKKIPQTDPDVKIEDPSLAVSATQENEVPNSEAPTAQSPAASIPAPKETSETVKLLIDCLKEYKFSEIQELLTDCYDFDGDAVFDRKNFKTYIDLSDFNIESEDFNGDYSIIFVEVSRPDANKIQSDFYELMTDENSDYSGDMNDYVKSALNSDDCPTTVYVCELKLLQDDGTWEIAFDRGLISLIDETANDPFASAGFMFGEEPISREESIEYIADNITLSVDGGIVSAVNNGNKEITAMSLKLEYVDKNGVIKRTTYREAFSASSFGMNGSYIMKPGYMWVEDKDVLFYEPEEYGATLNNCNIYVFDVQFRDTASFPVLSAEAKTFCDEFITIDTYKFGNARSDWFWSGYGVTELKISNKSEKTITHLALLVEFMDENGVIRSGKIFNIIDADNNESDNKIEPKSAWTLSGNYFFPLYHVPDSLVKQNKAKLSVVELDFD